MRQSISFVRFQAMLLKIAFNAEIRGDIRCPSAGRVRREILTLCARDPYRDHVEAVLEACYDEIEGGETAREFLNMTRAFEAFHQDFFGFPAALEDRPALLSGLGQAYAWTPSAGEPQARHAAE